ncbi:glycosyltransferase [Exiguobacterium sp. BRG2]|uniref:glycosyltransferase n=1 Tax=Exiguobacterium sp. BRG2 TaxID=2962584 RepID=UPI0028819005|nr:glycosyltransferase [Exiguobacterium sp. BRG2]MDT0172776.1 glycosyltransferase [Exiguobacterium sp. BRG2]
MKKIFVNATSCTVGGSKTILLQFINNMKKSNVNNICYYLFVADKKEIQDINDINDENLVVIEVKAKKWKDRLYWDFFGMKSWSEKNKINPDKIISLQNTGVNYNKEVKQIIYLHTPIPFVTYKWNIINKEERKLWFYKYVYPFFIKKWINSNTEFVVQSEWLKKSVSKKLKVNKNKIHVFFPDLPQVKLNSIEVEKNDHETSNFLFYPAMNYVYKNHNVIIQALKKIKVTNYSIYKRIKIVFTLDDNSNVAKKSKESGVQSRIKFTGMLNKEEVDYYYNNSKAVLFPSYIETFGLPLLEAKMYKKQILASNELFSQEILNDYEGVKFIDKFSSEDWANHIIEIYSKKIVNKNIDKKENVNIKTWSDFFIYVNNF